ncbi:hypothetical protein F5Y16DRAFT_369048 [Xylariaceae sp. FL0255]|nr:hypothetical protein F5Y16DRAFT_369048 [Xylariaceae sp. FL0255]
MTANGIQEKDSSSNADETLKEQEIQRALQHLDLLHAKCRDLRAALPHAVNTMPSIQMNAENPMLQAWRDISAYFKPAKTELDEFKALYTSEESKKIMEQAKKSRDANPKGIKPWRYKDHPDWWDRAQK